MKAKIAITIDKEVLESVRKLAKAESRTISGQINKTLKDSLNTDRNK